MTRYPRPILKPTPQPSPVSSDNEESDNEYTSDDDDDAVGHGVAHGVLVFGDEPDSDLEGESELADVSIDEENYPIMNIHLTTMMMQ
jgi:hypothetical protein